MKLTGTRVFVYYPKLKENLETLIEGKGNCGRILCEDCLFLRFYSDDADTNNKGICTRTHSDNTESCTDNSAYKGEGNIVEIAKKLLKEIEGNYD